MTKVKAQTVFVRGNAINASTFGTLKTTIGKVDDKLSIAANAAAIQAVGHNNLNWMNDLFNVEGMRKQNGDLTKRGVELRDYIVHFAPINFTLNDGELTIKLTKNKKNRGIFYSLKMDDDGARIKVDALESPDFEQSLAEWRDAQGKGSDDDVITKKATTLAKNLEKMAGLIAGNDDKTNVTGSVEDYSALYEQAQAVAKAALAAVQSAESDFEGVDLAHAEQALSVTSASEKRADTDREKAAS